MILFFVSFGIIGVIILVLGRVFGEIMVVIMVIGNLNIILVFLLVLGYIIFLVLVN